MRVFNDSTETQLNPHISPFKFVGDFARGEARIV